jgi:hypothetical protein
MLQKIFEPEGDCNKQEARENCMSSSFIICTLQLHIIRMFKEDEMGVENSAHGRFEKCTQYFSWKTRIEETICKTHKQTTE